MSIDRRDTRGGSGARRLLTAVGVGAVALASLASPARAQLTVTIGGGSGYGSAPSNASAPPTTPPAAAPSGYGALQGQEGFALAAAYGRYTQYLSVLNYQQMHGGALPPTPDTKDYFTNGAAVTSVPSAGPGSAYFTNGSEATVLPSAAPAPTLTPVAPPPSGAPSPWVVVYQNPNSPAPAPPPVLNATPPPPTSEPVTRLPAMSFEDWLQSMGMSPPDEADDSKPELTSAEVETAPVAEPSALVNDVRERVSYALPEKARVHGAAGGGLGTFVGVTGAFAAGLILGGLAMLRLRDRMRQQETAPASTPPTK